MTDQEAGGRRALLLVDDDERLRTHMARALDRRGLDVRSAASFDEAMAVARETSPALALVDLRMPGASGLELVRALRAHDPAIRVVILTGYGSIATAVEAMRLGAVHYLQKPVDADDVVTALLYPLGNPRGLPTAPSELPSLDRVKWEHISRVLAECEGNVTVAARKLGLHRRSLQRMLNKLPGPK